MKTRIFIPIIFSLFLIQSCTAQNKQLTAGDTVPKFVLHDQNDSVFDIKNYIGKKIMVIYFYPKDESMVCTKEACTFRDSLPDFTKEGAMVIGINDGTVASHKHFQQKDNLPFTLLSDPDNKVAKMFGIKNGMLSSRVTFVVDITGQIVYTYDSALHGSAHAEKTLQFIREMQKKDKTN